MTAPPFNNNSNLKISIITQYFCCSHVEFLPINFHQRYAQNTVVRPLVLGVLRVGTGSGFPNSVTQLIVKKTPELPAKRKSSTCYLEMPLRFFLPHLNCTLTTSKLPASDI